MVLGRCSKDIELEELQKDRAIEKAEYARLLDAVRVKEENAQAKLEEIERTKKSIIEDKKKIEALVGEQQLKVQLAQAKENTAQAIINEGQAQILTGKKLQEDAKRRIAEADKYKDDVKIYIAELDKVKRDMSAAPLGIAKREKELDALIRVNKDKEAELMAREKRVNDDYKNNVVDAESNRKRAAELDAREKSLRI